MFLGHSDVREMLLGHSDVREMFPGHSDVREMFLDHREIPLFPIHGSLIGQTSYSYYSRMGLESRPAPHDQGPSTQNT